MNNISTRAGRSEGTCEIEGALRSSTAEITKLDAFEGLTPDEHKAISHGNACTLFRRLALPHDTTKTVRPEMQQPARGTKFGSAPNRKPATTVEE